MLLSNKIAIVTGAGGGMGGAIAIKFAGEGADIAVVDLNEQRLNTTLEEVKKLGRECIAIPTNITKSDQVQAMVEKVIEKFGRIDILVNAAGTLLDFADMEINSISDIPEDQWDNLVEVNLKGCFLVCKAVSRYMKEKQYGKIVNFSTLGAVTPPAVAPHYNAAKAGVLGLTYDMASELGPKGITVNAVLPGPIKTTFYEKIMGTMTEEMKEAMYKEMSKGAPLQRAGTADEVADVVLFLSSNMSSYVTGVGLLVAGGMPLTPRIGQDDHRDKVAADMPPLFGQKH